MLILTRRIGEEITIDGDIRLTVVSITGKRVRIGITAPSAVAVLRGELFAGCAKGAQPDRDGPRIADFESGEE